MASLEHDPPNEYTSERFEDTYKKLCSPKPIQNVLGIQLLDNMGWRVNDVESQFFKDTTSKMIPLLWKHIHNVYVGSKCRVVLLKLYASTSSHAAEFVRNHYNQYNLKFRSPQTIRLECEIMKDFLNQQAAIFMTPIYGHWLADWKYENIPKTIPEIDMITPEGDYNYIMSLLNESTPNGLPAASSDHQKKLEVHSPSINAPINIF